MHEVNRPPPITSLYLKSWISQKDECDEGQFSIPAFNFALNARNYLKVGFAQFAESDALLSFLTGGCNFFQQQNRYYNPINLVNHSPSQWGKSYMNGNEYIKGYFVNKNDLEQAGVDSGYILIFIYIYLL